MSYTTIGTALKTIIDTVPNLEAVYDYEPDELKEFPALTIQAAGHTAEFRSLGGSNMRTYQFMLRLYLPTMSGREAQAESDMRSILDDIVSIIDGNPTLNNTCSFASPSAARILPADREVPVTVAEIDVFAKAFTPR